MLKSMSKGDDGGPGIFEMLQEMRSTMKKEFEGKMDDLMKRIQELEVVTKKTDGEQQAEIDDLKMLANNQISQSEKMHTEINNLKMYKVD